jgi:predicted Zn-dependent peptidase
MDDGVFMIRAGIDKEKFDFAVSKIVEEIQTLITSGITELEFQNAIGYLTGQLQMGIESSDQMADFLGEQLLLQGHILTLDQILQQYHRLTLKDITQVFEMLKKESLYQYHIE